MHDAYDYIFPSENWLAGNGFSPSQEAPYEADTRRTPAYPAVIIAGMAMMGDSWPVFIGIIQVLMSVIMVLLIYLIARMLADEKVAFWASIFLGLSLGHVCYSVLVMSDILYAFLVLSATYILLRNRDQASWTRIGLLGLALGLATLTRPVGIFVPFLLIPYLIWGGKADWKKGLGQSVVMLVISFLVITPWLMRQGEVLGYKTVSTVPMRNLMLYNGAMLQAHKEGRTSEDLYIEYENQVINELEERGEAGNQGLLYKTYEERGKEMIKSDFPTYFILHLKTSIVSFLPNVNDLLEILGVTSGSRGTLGVLQNEGLISAVKYYFDGKLWAIPILIPFLMILGFVYLLSLFGLWNLFKRDLWAFLLFGMLIGYFMFVSGPVAVPRFRIPVQPHFCLLAGIGWMAVRAWKAERKNIRTSDSQNVR